MNWIEWIGYAGSALVVVSLMMSAVVRLRVLNLAGALFFAVYGALVGALPVLLVNVVIVVVNAAHLAKVARARRDFFELMPMHDARNPYLSRFLDFHADDIRRHFPDFELAALSSPVVVFILRDLMPAGLVICSPAGGGTLRVELDYVLPAYRDFACARWFYREWGPRLEKMGFARFAARTGAGVHRRYLERMGYRSDPARGEGWYVRPTDTAA
ncbi:YgjV family protein [bacterium]|nr:YgjV family protein [bacterium]